MATIEEAAREAAKLHLQIERTADQIRTLFEPFEDPILDRALDRAQKEPHMPNSASAMMRRHKCRAIDAELQRRADQNCNDLAARNR